MKGDLKGVPYMWVSMDVKLVFSVHHHIGWYSTHFVVYHEARKRELDFFFESLFTSE
jgi:hypothetical protein